MKARIILRPKAAERIRKAILDYKNESRGYFKYNGEYVECSPAEIDGIGFGDKELCGYITGSGKGEYVLEGNTLTFRGYRISFRDGTAIFCVEKKDVLSYEILESTQMARGLWEFSPEDR